MFVDEDVDVALPPLPLPLDWSSRIPVSGMSSMMSPPAIDGMAADTSAITVKTVTPRKRRLMDAGIPCPPFAQDVESPSSRPAVGWPERVLTSASSSPQRRAERQQGPCPGGRQRARRE